MDLKAKYLSETCLDPIEYLRQLRQTTEPIGGGTEYCEDGELVEYDVAIEAIKKANDAFVEKAVTYLEATLFNEVCYGEIRPDIVQAYINDFKRAMRQ